MPGEINDQVLEYSFCYTIHEVWPLLGSAVVLPELFLNWGCFRLPWTRESCHSLFSGSLSSSFYTEIVSLDFSHINVHLWCFSLQEAAWTFFPALQLCSSLFCPLCLLQPDGRQTDELKMLASFPFCLWHPSTTFLRQHPLSCPSFTEVLRLSSFQSSHLSRTLSPEPRKIFWELPISALIPLL